MPSMSSDESSHEDQREREDLVGVDGRAYALLLLLGPLVVLVGELLGVLNWLGGVVRRG